MILYALLKILCIHISSFVHITKSGLNEANVRQSFVLTQNYHDINKTNWFAFQWKQIAWVRSSSHLEVT